MRALLLVWLSGSAALAETAKPMTAADFEAWSTGKTLSYSSAGGLWGSETHLAGRATLDDGDGDICRPGHWYPVGDAICFAYDGDPGPYCWRFVRQGSQVLAVEDTQGAPETQNAPDAQNDTTFYTVTLTDTPVDCTAKAGV